jgi:hypothetical protein
MNSIQFDIVINTELTNIIELIKTNNIFIYVIILDDEILCCYFFRKTCTFIQKNQEVLSCFASINNTNNDVFINGFFISFLKIKDKIKFGFAAIENISHNDIIVDHLLTKQKPLITSPTAYFFYNFAYYTFKSKKVLLIN